MSDELEEENIEMSDVTVFENGHENCMSDKQRDKIKKCWKNYRTCETN